MHGYSTINGLRFARCVKQDGFYTYSRYGFYKRGLLGVLNKMCPIRVVFVLAILSFAKCVKLSNP